MAHSRLTQSASTPPALEALLARLATPRLVFFPIRHHSPACAWHLDRLIRERRPRTVLVEGPASFTPLIPLALDARTKAPFAIYTTFVDAPAAGAPKPSTAEIWPSRFAAWYPFCDYSPELAALRAGAAVGAELRFIDLDYAEQVRGEREAASPDSDPRADSLLAERHLQRSRYLRALARRAGCRDHNELWDHLFETRLGKGEAAEFARDVAAWCFMARAESTAEELATDGSAARESAMADAISAAIAEADGGLVLVVTGGFHTVALPDLLDAPMHPLPAPKEAGEIMTCLVRYSFEQLDALNGYAAGMPSPFYYDAVWRRKMEGAGEPFLDTAAQVFVELGRLTRKKQMAAALSPADEIAALEQARRLAMLRGHPGPLREDLLDGVRSCFVKGDLDTDGALLLDLARHALTGSTVGEVPPEAGAPPLVEDFRVHAREMRLDIGSSVRRKASLEIYRKARHRRLSRFFHCLSFLGVPFAICVAGPDFVSGSGLDRIIEHWDWQWSPLTEARLVDASILGSTIEEAVVNRLARVIGELETKGQGRNARGAVAMLVSACRMGLHRHTGRLLGLIAEQVNADPEFPALVAAMSQLVMLWQSREPLEAHRLPEIPELIRAAYERACYLTHNLARIPAEAAGETLEALIILRSHVGSAPPGLLDPDLFWPRLEPLPRQYGCAALLAGGAAGLLHGGERLDSAGLLAMLDGFLRSSSGKPEEQVAFLSGLLRTCRELAWREPALAGAVDRLLAQWSDEEFITRLPHLRLAFANLTPRETDQVGAVVARLHGGGEIQRIVSYEFNEADVLTALRAEAAVKESLRRDGLETWLNDL